MYTSIPASYPQATYVGNNGPSAPTYYQGGGAPAYYQGGYGASSGTGTAFAAGAAGLATGALLGSVLGGGHRSEGNRQYGGGYDISGDDGGGDFAGDF